MAIGTPHALYSAATTVTAQPTHTFTLTGGASVGERVWFFASMECGDTSPAVPVWDTTDSKGNTWTTFRTSLRNGGGTGGTAMLYGSTCVVSNALVAGDTVSINNPNSDFSPTRIAVCIAAASGVDVIDQSATADPGSTSSLSVGPVSTTGEQILWGWWGGGVRAFTPGANFTEMAELASTAGSSDRQLSLEYRIVTTDGSYSATGTLASATTVVGSLNTWKATSAPAPTETGVYLLSSGGVWQAAQTTLL